MTSLNKARVLILAPVMDSLTEKLEQQFSVEKYFEQDDPHSFLANKGKGIVGLVTRGDFGAKNSVLELLPDLKVISVFGVGTDAIDLDYTADKNIHVEITEGVLTDDVADMALALLLATSRNICQADQFVREGKWQNGGFPLSSKVSGKRVGIFGMGQIGQAIARRALGFDMTVAYASNHKKPELPYTFYPDVKQLAAESDVLIIAVSGGPKSAGIIDKSVFNALPNSALVINISRGSVINQGDLIQALTDKQIAGAGLDVFAEEPNVPQELIAMTNVVLQPHLGSATHETRQAMSEKVLSNLHKRLD
ncbi:MAG: 2-hydroxyacid dehydrogenase [Ewingella americana]|jgi:hydroxypyruvate reductase|uniref:D-3-phosphoglycerate dehydrogenase n=2 Tax=Ewingella americana TaxID=41202 RepID=A0A085G9I3_EWIA3|nr:2-hydroxyacid dehydrogenase [Ewingella americana]KAA8730388.1 2-hydroxyacid dehydrogenase [Ewingella americana]KFC80378.1 D-3-phosphoglycerate dehydrogenase [Ewingella americana ATCC 33852]MCI1677733.1 2-hydroxyacid dehydrogenase [Ewingella americana]MCI1852578.1 2-hydroxyacid dehydrogenase [Ewingella americana]MCI1863815.1 2-hydroxyacid dehydrogenase [Ewingella americana]